MLSDQLNGTKRVAVRGFNGVHLKRNIGYPPQDAIAGQRSGDVLRVANVCVKLRQKISDSVTNNIMTCGAMLGSLLAQAGFSDLQRILLAIGDKGRPRGEDPWLDARRQRGEIGVNNRILDSVQRQRGLSGRTRLRAREHQPVPGLSRANRPLNGKGGNPDALRQLRRLRYR